MKTLYIMTLISGKYDEDIVYKQTFYTNKEDAYIDAYNYCLEAYTKELIYQTKHKSQKAEEWKKQNTIENFQHHMTDFKDKWDNYEMTSQNWDTDHLKGVYCTPYLHHDTVILSMVEIH